MRDTMDKNSYASTAGTQVPAVQPEILDKLKNDNHITALSFERKNELLTDLSLQDEIGYVRMDGGGYLVAMRSEMPAVTKEMIDWWFWWHPQQSERYQIWFPSEHFSISYANRDKDYFRKPFTSFKPNMQFPVERVGKRKFKISIRFVTPKQFGFDTTLFASNKIETVVCGYVGAFSGRFEHTKMAHIFKSSENGLVIISRFWMGTEGAFTNKPEHSLLNKIAGSRFVLSRGVDENQAYEMAVHCNREYRNLARILPDLYQRFH